MVDQEKDLVAPSTEERQPRRTVKSVVEAVFSEASEMVQRGIIDALDIAGVNTLAELRKFNLNQGEIIIEGAFQSEALRILDAYLAGTLGEDVETSLRVLAKQRDIEFMSLFGRRGMPQLAEFVRHLAGNANWSHLLASAS